MEEIDHEYRTDCFVCPYCGYEFDECWDWPNDGHTKCYECDKEFRYSQDTETYYSTEQVPQPMPDDTPE